MLRVMQGSFRIVRVPDQWRSALTDIGTGGGRQGQRLLNPKSENPKQVREFEIRNPKPRRAEARRRGETTGMGRESDARIPWLAASGRSIGVGTAIVVGGEPWSTCCVS